MLSSGRRQGVDLRRRKLLFLLLDCDTDTCYCHDDDDDPEEGKKPKILEPYAKIAKNTPKNHSELP